MTTLTTKDEFRIVLQPMLDLFDHKKETLHSDQWIRFVNATRHRVISDPEQFLGHDLPPAEIIREAVEEIFDDYLEKEHVAEPVS